jgi:hypothetical protein
MITHDVPLNTVHTIMYSAYSCSQPALLAQTSGFTCQLCKALMVHGMPCFETLLLAPFLPPLHTSTVIIGLLRSLVSHTRMVLSTLALTNTVSSVGLHCKSSTLPWCPVHMHDTQQQHNSKQQLHLSSRCHTRQRCMHIFHSDMRTGARGSYLHTPH